MSDAKLTAEESCRQTLKTIADACDQESLARAGGYLFRYVQERVAAPAPRCAMRPWRLTRRARVEMESALARLRGDVVASGVSGTCAAASWVMQAGVTVGFRCWEHDYGSTRILRARVALALRAALLDYEGAHEMPF